MSLNVRIIFGPVSQSFSSPRSIYLLPRVVGCPINRPCCLPAISRSGLSMASNTKTLKDFFQPAAKRMKPSSPRVSISTNSPEDSNSKSELTPEQRSKIEFNKCLAKSKSNHKICLERVSKSGGGDGNGVNLVDLLVEETWSRALSEEMQKSYMKELVEFIHKEVTCGSVPVYPPQHLIFNALNSTPLDQVKVVIIGQDPYHGPRQAMGLAFSVPNGIKAPSSLVNIFKELKQDLGCSIPSHGNLEKWTVQGILLLNTVLTVREHQANSHAKKGWEIFTDAVIKTVSHEREGVVFLLWGRSAQEKSRLINATKHHILQAAHPSGLSANRGFFGCKHFSQTNQILETMKMSPIDWQL